MNLSNNGKKLSDFLDEKMMEQSFTNEDLVHFIRCDQGDPVHLAL